MIDLVNGSSGSIHRITQWLDCLYTPYSRSLHFVPMCVTAQTEIPCGSLSHLLGQPTGQPHLHLYSTRLIIVMSWPDVYWVLTQLRGQKIESYVNRSSLDSLHVLGPRRPVSSAPPIHSYSAGSLMSVAPKLGLAAEQWSL